MLKKKRERMRDFKLSHKQNNDFIQMNLQINFGYKFR